MSVPTALEDIITVLDFLCQQKTFPQPIARAMDRLREKAKVRKPLDVTTVVTGQPDADD